MAFQICFTLVFLVLAGLPNVRGNWSNMRNGGTGPGTIYGLGQNSAGSCSYGKNMANTAGLPWSTVPPGASDGGTGMAKTYVALNHVDLAGGTACGSCIWFRGTGPGIGVESRKISSEWQYGLVDNVCPECNKGALDLARSFAVGDGIWTVEWHAVPCQVGDSTLHYNFPASNPYYFNMVVSNGRVPVQSVSAVIAGAEVPLTRTSNNQWAYHNSAGSYTFPLELKVTPTCGQPVADVVDSISGGYGKAQFGRAGCPSEGNPTTTNPTPTDIGGISDLSLSTESSSSQRALSTPTATEQAVTNSPQTAAKTSRKDSPQSTSSPTASPTPKPTALPSPQPTTSPKPPSNSSVAPTKALNVKKTYALQPWSQCGDYYGKYRGQDCVTKGYSCVKINRYYMQCLNDKGKGKPSPRRSLR